MRKASDKSDKDDKSNNTSISDDDDEEFISRNIGTESIERFTRVTHSHGWIPSSSLNAIIKRGQKMCNKSKYVNGDLGVYGWSIFEKIWKSSHAQKIKRQIDKAFKKLIPDDYALRGDNKCLMIPTELFHSMVHSNVNAYSRYFTQLMGVGPNADNYEKYIANTHVLLSLPGAQKQSFHLDKNKHDHVIMLHAITRRYIWIRDFRGDFF